MKQSRSRVVLTALEIAFTALKQTWGSHFSRYEKHDTHSVQRNDPASCLDPYSHAHSWTWHGNHERPCSGCSRYFYLKDAFTNCSPNRMSIRCCESPPRNEDKSIAILQFARKNIKCSLATHWLPPSRFIFCSLLLIIVLWRLHVTMFYVLPLALPRELVLTCSGLYEINKSYTTVDIVP